MGNFLVILQAFLSIAPLVIQLIKQVEDLFPESGKGKEKAEYVRLALETAFEKVEGVSVKFAEVWKVAEPFITKIVALFNNNGTFGKK